MERWVRRGLLLGLCGVLAGCALQVNTSVQMTPDQQWIQWKDSPAAREGYIFITGRIERELAARVANQILWLDQEYRIPRITLVINSDGGETAGFRAIYNAIRMTTKPVDALNIGNCYSAACGIFAAATGRRLAYRNTHFMIHRPSMPGVVLLQGIYKDRIDFEAKIYEAVLRDAGHLPERWFPLSHQDRFFTAEEALSYRFVDEIVDDLAQVRLLLAAR